MKSTVRYVFKEIIVKHFLPLSLAVFFMCSTIGFAQVEFVDGVQLTTTKAPWSIQIRGNDLDITGVQAKPDEASAYFMMASGTSKLNVSVFIEPVDKCKTTEECRDYVLKVGNPSWGKFEQLAKGKLKDFSYFEFYRPEVKGMPVKMLDMYAQYVSDGYWVDVHISKTLYTKVDRALFEKVINSIVFIPKKATPDISDFETQLVKGQSAASAWLSLWDKSKCKESFAALAPLTKENIDEVLWIDYCKRAIQDFGANRTRKPIAAAFARALPAKTDRPLAILAYHSSFENQPSVVEITALMLQKDGSWWVTNYLTP
ncbi:MAG: DUF4019 domain-containing protein [Blastocatellia bacterium]|nr:DUF4019 domain-containing protein [Blastocatellia bacterium]